MNWLIRYFMAHFNYMVIALSSLLLLLLLLLLILLLLLLLLLYQMTILELSSEIRIAQDDI